MVFLEQQGLLHVSGSKAASFLQGQLTLDIQEIDAGHSPLTAICNIKGRVLYSLRVISLAEGYLLLLPKTLVNPAIANLEKYARLSRVNLKEVSDTHQIVGFWGENALSLIQQHFGYLPETNDSSVNYQDIAFIHLTNPLPRILSIIPKHQLSVIKNLQIKQISETLWDAFDLQAGLPSISLATQGLFTPHEINLPALNGVSFTKGCYIGQEIVARMQYLGKLKQHAYRVILETESTPTPGAILYDPHGLEVGQIVNSTADPWVPQRYLTLIVMSTNQAQQQEWLIHSPFSGRLQISA